MPRCAREKIENGTYHICTRGNNKQDIFLDDKDREEYLRRLKHYKEKYKMNIYAYCLMTNHVHILVYDNNQDISKFMQGLNLSYTLYFNNRHGRTGHLLQGRFTSVLVKSNVQLLQTSRYIHLNPVRADMVDEAVNHKWSSYHAYLNGTDSLDIVEVEFLLSIISNNRKESRKAYIQYINDQDIVDDSEEIAITIEKKENDDIRRDGIKKMSYEEAYDYLCHKWKLKKEKIHEYLSTKGIAIYFLGLVSRLSWSQIARNLDIHESIVYRKVKLLTERMIQDKGFCRQIDEMIFLNFSE